MLKMTTTGAGDEDYKMTVAVDIVVFGFRTTANALQVLLIRRGTPPFKGQLALPGGRVGLDESAETAARRELHEEASIRPTYLEQLYTFSEPDRDPRGRVIGVAYFALLNTDHVSPQAGSDASTVEWFDVEKALAENLAFDHRKVLQKALDRIRGKCRYSPIGFDLLPRKFTISELRQLYETIVGRPLNPSNFRRKIIAIGILSETGEFQVGQHRPAPLYKFNKKAYDDATRNRFNFEI